MDLTSYATKYALVVDDIAFNPQNPNFQQQSENIALKDQIYTLKENLNSFKSILTENTSL